ncbi:MAG: SUMF1/EgtB/PvdO family nonheme iron enzyme, partial [Fibrobacter sp.]|nr:SUMF1/EgtB/PvdO family nonheme iron enzyme [Fibrobacter sp.]
IDETADVGDYAIYRENSYKMGKKSQAYGPQMVASKKPNAWGIYDMSGNVAEWTRDKYFMFSFWVESSNPTGAAMGFSKVYKGGSWKDGESALNLTKSDDEDPRYWSDVIGFRCVFPRKLFEGR